MKNSTRANTTWDPVLLVAQVRAFIFIPIVTVSAATLDRVDANITLSDALHPDSTTTQPIC
jgi:hypothetical protein